MKALLVFLDGVGIGTADPDTNPFLTAELPTLRELFGGGLPTLDHPQLRGTAADGSPVTCLPLDATLGVPGRPQSGTGQCSLLTGQNAAALFGRHFGPWTPVRLRPWLADSNLLRRARNGGHRVAFANAYPRGFLERVPTRRVAAPPLAADSVGALNRHEEALAAGDAVASEIVNAGWRRRLGFRSLPRIGPSEAGANLARIAAEHDLTLFAHYDTDHAGHEGTRAAAHAALERVDAFLGGLLASRPETLVVAVASDHGNIESLGGGHTRNPVMGLWIGATAPAGLRGIVDVAPALIDLLDTPPD